MWRGGSSIGPGEANGRGGGPRESGAIDEVGPNAAFHRAYFLGSSDLRLPAGTWRIDATTALAGGQDCDGPALDLSTAVEVIVAE